MRNRFGDDSEALQLVQALFETAQRDSEHVRVFLTEDQIESLASQGHHSPFYLALGIGTAGERVALQLHARTGWVPDILRLDIAR